jgi:hypothetical protein
MRLLTPCRHQNIVWEAFSGFNAQYPDIMHVRHASPQQRRCLR